MPQLTSTQSSLILSVAKGNSLIVRNRSGVETVTGSSVAREDATAVLGSGAYVYGPQTSASTLTISTTGVCDYDIVAGDPTPATEPARVVRSAATGAPASLIDPATGQAVGGGGVKSNRVGLFGDSITQQTTITNLSTADNGRFVRQYANNGWAGYANFLAGGCADIVVNGGIAGDTAENMVNRVVSSVLQYGLDGVTVLAGTNDINNGKSAAQVISWLQQIYEQCTAAGTYVFALTILPRPLLSAERRATVARVNRWIIDYWTRNRGLGESVDTFSRVVDPASATQAMIAGVSGDNLHPSVAGAWRMAPAVAAAFQSRYGVFARPLISSNADDYGVNSTSANLLPNPLMVNNAGTIAQGGTGVVATGWTLWGNAASVGSLQARADGYGNDQVIVISPSGSNQQTNFSAPLPAAGYVAGDRIQFECELTIDANPSKLQSIFMRMSSPQWTGDAPPAVGNGYPYQALYIPVPTQTKMILRTPIATVPAGITSLEPLFEFYVDSGGSATVRIGRAAVWKLQ